MRGLPMLVRNMYQSALAKHSSHGGRGLAAGATLFDGAEFKSGLRFINYTELDPGVSIGYHAHGRDEEVYVILEGGGEMTVDGETRRVGRGDVIVNPPGGSHGLKNDGDGVLRVLVFEVGM